MKSGNFFVAAAVNCGPVGCVQVMSATVPMRAGKMPVKAMGLAGTIASMGTYRAFDGDDGVP
jgi:hypothetical protein